MTIQYYNDKGYSIAESFSQAAIDRAEEDVKQNYILPIIGSTPMSDKAEKVMMDIVYLLLMQRNIKLTRSGAKKKDNENSQNTNEDNALREQSLVCNVGLQSLMDSKHSWTGVCTDICKISFKSNFYSI